MNLPARRHFAQPQPKRGSWALALLSVSEQGGVDLSWRDPAETSTRWSALCWFSPCPPVFPVVFPCTYRSNHGEHGRTRGRVKCLPIKRHTADRNAVGLRLSEVTPRRVFLGELSASTKQPHASLDSSSLTLRVGGVGLFVSERPR